MIQEVKDAIESARTVEIKTLSASTINPARRHSSEMIRALVLAVVRELPDDMTVAELRDELDIVQAPTL